DRLGAAVVELTGLTDDDRPRADHEDGAYGGVSRHRSGHASRGHLLHELAEQVVAVVRARARLGVVLDGKNGKLPVAESLDRTVVQVDVGQLVFRLREEPWIDGE